MATLSLPTALKSEISAFTSIQKGWLKEPDGLRQVADLAAFSRTLRAADASQPEQVAVLARNAGQWVGKLPPLLMTHDAAPLIDLKTITNKAAHQAVVDGLQVLNLGAKSLLQGVLPPDKNTHAAWLQVAWGADAASVALRKPLLDRKAPGLPAPPGPNIPRLPGMDSLPDISHWVREGVLRELMRTFAECGWAAQQEAQWVSSARPFGKVVGLHAEPPCGGGTLVIIYEAFGPQPPDKSQVADILVSLPTFSGCVHLSLRTLGALAFDAAQWSDRGELKVVLPGDVCNGPVGFITIPPPLEGTGPCTSGSLVGAAHQFQAELVKTMGPVYGVAFGQQVVDLASTAEAGRHRPLPCATAQPDQLNLLTAGPPVIHQFRVVESGPIHPRGTVTLEWSVYNATEWELSVLPVPDSVDAHELRALPNLATRFGRVTLQVPCTRRWEARIKLVARNKNGCGNPAEAVVSLRSGFSHYLIGISKADITDRRAGLGMAGFAYERQRTDGQVLHPLYARAFVISANGKLAAGSDQELLAIVVADIWTCTQMVKREVLKRLQLAMGRSLKDVPWMFNEHNLLIAGTHTHAGPGGYSEYLLYNLTCGGFDQGVFDTIVNGIVTAVTNALAKSAPGRVFLAAADLAGVGGNRSMEAWRRNPEAIPGAGPDLWTDRQMLLLRFDAIVHDRENGQHAIGALNWHALHPTSLGQFNSKVSGDNKGLAEAMVEDRMNSAPANGFGGFVAAFGNASAGDVSGNVDQDLRGAITVHKPLGGDVSLQVTVPPLVRLGDPWSDNLKRLEKLASRQAEHALALIANATTEVIGPLQGQHVFIDMGAGIPIDRREGALTWPAALGVSFGAGSSEDSIAYATVGFADIDIAIIEGVDRLAHAVGAADFWAGIALSPQAPLILGTLAAGALPAGPLLGLLLSTIVTLPMRPLGRSWIGAWVGSLALPGKVNEQCPPMGGDLTRMAVPAPGNLPGTDVAGHGDKPVMFAVGYTKLESSGDNGASWTSQACPMVPNVVPAQLLRIGTLAIAAVPAEFTATAGRRLKSTLFQALSGQVKHVAVSNYSNGYSGYVTTEEEYGAQHYEGASTLYGPHTLEAYQQTFAGLARRLGGGSAAIAGESAPFAAPSIFRRPHF